MPPPAKRQVGRQSRRLTFVMVRARRRQSSSPRPSNSSDPHLVETLDEIDDTRAADLHHPRTGPTTTDTRSVTRALHHAVLGSRDELPENHPLGYGPRNSSLTDPEL
jgi:hypothetical protein